MNRITSFYSDKRVLVSGASGYLATNFVDSLKDFDCTIVRLSKSGRFHPVSGRASIIDMLGDMCGKAVCRRAMQGVDVVFHFGAQTDVYTANEDPVSDFQANVRPMISLLEICREQSICPIMVFAGTVTEVGIPGSIPVNETVSDNPVTIYDLHKLVAENYLKYYCRQGIVKGTTLRLANVYGPGPRSSSSGRGVLNLMMRKALAGEELTIYDKGDCLRDYVYVDDVVRAFLRAAIYIEELNGRHYVIGSAEGHSIAEAINLIAECVSLKSGRRVQVRHVDQPAHQSPIENRNFVADTTSFTKATSWKVRYSLIEGINNTIEAFQANSVPVARRREQSDDLIKLNIGCGRRPLAGYINIDSDDLASLNFPDDMAIYDYDIFDLPYPDGSVAEVRADSLVEHLSFIEEPKFFYEVKRVLRPGGIFEFSTTNFEEIVKLWLAAEDDWKDFFRNDAEAIANQHWFGQYSYAAENRWGYLSAMIFGSQNGEGQFHKNCYTAAKIRAVLKRLQFENTEISEFRWQGDRDPMLQVRTMKPQET